MNTVTIVLTDDPHQHHDVWVATASTPAGRTIDDATGQTPLAAVVRLAEQLAAKGATDA